MGTAEPADKVRMADAATTVNLGRRGGEWRKRRNRRNGGVRWQRRERRQHIRAGSCDSSTNSDPLNASGGSGGPTGSGGFGGAGGSAGQPGITTGVFWSSSEVSTCPPPGIESESGPAGKCWCERYRWDGRISSLEITGHRYVGAGRTVAPDRSLTYGAINGFRKHQPAGHQGGGQTRPARAWPARTDLSPTTGHPRSMAGAGAGALSPVLRPRPIPPTPGHPRSSLLVRRSPAARRRNA